MVAEIHRLQSNPVAINWMCSACGEDASCNCGAPLMSKAKRAAEAIAANPQMSDRAIAKEIGASPTTVGEARKTQLSSGGQLEERVGLDGKQRRMPVRQAVLDEEDEDDVEEAPATPAELRDAFLIFSEQAKSMARYEGPIDDTVLAAARATASAWSRLVQTIEEKKQ